MAHEAEATKITITGGDMIEHDITALTKMPTLNNVARSGKVMGDLHIAIQGTTTAFSDFGAAWRRWPEALYRQCVGKLPGSPRTKRLRKKRRDAMDRWFYMVTKKEQSQWRRFTGKE